MALDPTERYAAPNLWSLMKRLSLVTAATATIFLLACMCGGDDAAEDYAVDDYAADDEWQMELTEPWESMNLPIGSGVVFLADETMLMVSYEGDQVSSLAGSYGSAIEAAGWSMLEDYSTPEFTAMVYNKGSDALGFGLGAEDGLTFAYLEMMPGAGSGETTSTSVKPTGTGSGRPAFMDRGISGSKGQNLRTGGKGAKGSRGSRGSRGSKGSKGGR